MHVRGRGQRRASLHLAGRGCLCFICAIYSLSLSGFRLDKMVRLLPFIPVPTVNQLIQLSRFSFWVHWLGWQSELYKANSIF